MSNTNTQSRSDTYSETNADYITGKVYQELLNIHNRGLITRDRAVKMRETLLIVQRLKALDFFEIQFLKPDGNQSALRFTLDIFGNINVDNRSGGIDYYTFPDETFVRFYLNLDWVNKKDNAQIAFDYLMANGCSDNGKATEGYSEYTKSFSKEGYGFKQNKIGW
jgi:hypothetical protein